MTPTEPDGNRASRVEERRRAKVERFRDSARSPLPISMRGESFPGLEYYDPDPTYRFVLPLHEHDETETVAVETTADGERAYRPTDGADRLWVPFRDETNGEETYGAGRYLDLERDRDRADGEWTLDFNEAYNPTCAYNRAYECPLTPMENWLDARIEAGERDFPADPVGADERE